ncbi:DUF1763-domain-containing protein [Hypoxylon trugodes]|uniref:DUF1763-domain-containing protein n=1 Tax=Hypoxylon trugodes TaxID=326681 RepID=UPI0021A16663|nr:DUF1763-domain-containing protein [Hypoxylon trugodes]KAI1388720.1 DUF1763-domain-containing protein [Hypoxylon trugodes]
MSKLEIIHAYRHLYRGLLHAVQFSKPARYVAQDRLRTAFRAQQFEFDPRKIARTLRFLEAAARTRGLEHNILKNLLITASLRRGPSRSWKPIKESDKPTKLFEKHIKKSAYVHYETTVAMLNASMGLCLR